MGISWQNVKESLREAVIVFAGVFLAVTLYGLYAGDVNVEKTLCVTAIICVVLEIFS